MKTFIFVIAAFVLPITSFAMRGNKAEADEAAEPEIQVLVDEKTYDPKEFSSNKKIKVNKLTKRKPKYEIPLKADRDAVFSKVPKLNTVTDGMDEFDKDTLYLDAKSITLEDLKKKYPNVNSEILKKLSKTLKK